MHFRKTWIVLLAVLISACNPSTHEHNSHDDHDHSHNENNGHEIEEAHSDSHDHDKAEHSHAKVSYTAYSEDFELFAEADVFIVGETASILAHFTHLPEFHALEEGSVTAKLIVGQNSVSQKLDQALRKGIYRFELTPSHHGSGTLEFEIIEDGVTSVIRVENVVVHKDHHALHEVQEEDHHTQGQSIPFTKEQSWRIDFATEKVGYGSFGPVIRSVAEVNVAKDETQVIAANTSGIVQFIDHTLLEGKEVQAGHDLVIISSDKMAENNLSVKLAEARSDFEMAKANYERHERLAKEQIISEKELLTSRNSYDRARAVLDNLVDNFSENGQVISSNNEGYIKEIWVTNGQYVEVGQTLLQVNRDKKLVLTAYLQQEYAAVLPLVKTAVIKANYNDKTYTLEELNGRILSYGKSTAGKSYLLPIHIQVDNEKARLVEGSMVEVFLKTSSADSVISIPKSALLEEQGLHFVLVQLNPEEFEKREVRIGRTDGIRTAVVSGLGADERVITRGAKMVALSQGMGSIDAHSGHVH